MKRFSSVLIAALLVLAVSSPALAKRDSQSKSCKTTKKHHSYYAAWKERIHQKIVNYQFRILKKKYNKSDPDAQQLFVEYLGDALPSAEEQIQALREGYEQNIAELNATIAAQQQQLEDLETLLNAACDARLASAQEEWQTTAQQQLDAMSAAHQTDLDNLTTQLNTACDERVAEEYLAWQAEAESQCQGSGGQDPGVINTDPIMPYAVDVNGSGEIYVLNPNQPVSVTVYDSSGVQINQWQPGTLVQPVDLALDSQGNIYIIDEQASQPLQKFSPDGTPMTLAQSPFPILPPFGLFITSDDNIYIPGQSFSSTGSVLVLNASGGLVQTFGQAPELGNEVFRDITVDENNQMIYVLTNSMVARFYILGNYMDYWTGDFGAASGIAVGLNGDIYVADTQNNEIDHYDSIGTPAASFAQDADHPSRIVTDSGGRLFVADYGNMQVRIFE